MKKSPIELINLSFSAIMVLLTIVGFFVFLFTDLMLDSDFGTKRYVMAFIFLAYAIFRSYRMYGVFKAQKNTEE